jgi:hypothetical protein
MAVEMVTLAAQAARSSVTAAVLADSSGSEAGETGMEDEKDRIPRDS